MVADYQVAIDPFSTPLNPLSRVWLGELIALDGVLLQIMSVLILLTQTGIFQW
ncbi:MAG: hypothetical protein ACLP9Y_21790 [Mycobacterium sp.]